MHDADALVVGAGPAGLAAAIALAQRGRHAVVLEKRRPPLDKACGEGIMPAGVRALEALGVRTESLRAAPFQGVRFLEGTRELSARFATRPGLGVRRSELSSALLAAASRAGVEVRFGCELLDFDERADGVDARTARGDVRTRLLVAADGLGSRVRERAGLALSPDPLRRFGVRRHFQIEPWSDFVEVHWRDGSEAYVTPVAPGEVGVALLWRGEGGSYAQQLARFPALAARLASARPVSEARGAGPFWQRARRRYAGHVALVGDAAGYTDAVTGEGISLALVSAQALAHAVASGQPLRAYERAWRRASRAHRAIARLLRTGILHPRLRRAAFAALGGAPSGFELLLRVAAGEPLRASAAPLEGSLRRSCGPALSDPPWNA